MEINTSEAERMVGTLIGGLSQYVLNSFNQAEASIKQASEEITRLRDVEVEYLELRRHIEDSEPELNQDKVNTPA